MRPHGREGARSCEVCAKETKKTGAATEKAIQNRSRGGAAVFSDRLPFLLFFFRCVPASTAASARRHDQMADWKKGPILNFFRLCDTVFFPQLFDPLSGPLGLRIWPSAASFAHDPRAPAARISTLLSVPFKVKKITKNAIGRKKKRENQTTGQLYPSAKKASAVPFCSSRRPPKRMPGRAPARRWQSEPRSGKKSNGPFLVPGRLSILLPSFF